MELFIKTDDCRMWSVIKDLEKWDLSKPMACAEIISEIKMALEDLQRLDIAS